MKANYGRTGEEIRLRWVDGVFQREAGVFGLDVLARDAAVDEVFLRLLRLHEQQEIEVSPKPCASYAPNVFAAHTEAGGIGKRAFKAAMERLLHAHKVRVRHVGPPSRRKAILTAFEITE